MSLIVLNNSVKKTSLKERYLHPQTKVFRREMSEISERRSLRLLVLLVCVWQQFIPGWSRSQILDLFLILFNLYLHVAIIIIFKN